MLSDRLRFAGADLVAVLTALACASCSAEESTEPSDAAAADAMQESAPACDPNAPPDDCGVCVTGDNRCGGMYWVCEPSGGWSQRLCVQHGADADTGPSACAALESDASVGDASPDGGMAQDRCAPDWTNPAECPADEPAAGAPCAGLGLECVYASGSTDWLGLLRCNDQTSTWDSTVVRCRDDCVTPDGGTMTGGPWESCGSGLAVTCGSASRTDQEELDRVVREIAECCGGLDENQLTVWFEGGCAIGMGLARAPVDPGFEACFSSLVAGRRFSCATSLPCAQAEWSTVM